MCGGRQEQATQRVKRQQTTTTPRPQAIHLLPRYPTHLSLALSLSIESMAEVINFYSTRGVHGCFSNFSRHRVFLGGKEWPTSEVLSRLPVGCSARDIHQSTNQSIIHRPFYVSSTALLPGHEICWYAARGGGATRQVTRRRCCPRTQSFTSVAT